MTAKKNTTTTYAPVTQVQDNATSIKLIQQTLEYMIKGIDEIKNSINGLRIEIKEGYATKEELKTVREAVEELTDLKGWALKIIIGTVIIALLGLVIIRT